jgi:tetratricopeptide (TPR) repeat protein
MSVAASSAVDPARVLERAIAALQAPGSLLPIEDVDSALRVSPTDPRLWHVKGLLHREEDRRELAIPALRRAVKLAPNEPIIVHGYARTLLEAGLPSVEPFAQAMKLNPDKPEVVRGMIAALIAERRIADAIAGLESVLARSPLWTEGHSLLASVRWAEGERDNFTRSFDEAIAANPTSLELRRDQLILLMHADQWDAALDRIERGRSQVGEHPLFDCQEAVVRSETGDVEGADRLFALFPSGAVADFDIRKVRHFLRSDRPAEAGQIIETWLETPQQDMFWPYAASLWRLTSDPRSEWLEGDERLVGIYDIADRLPPLAELAAALRALHTVRGQPLAQSVRGGTQTDGHLFQRIEPVFIALREAIRATVAEHAAALPRVDPKHPLLRDRPDPIRFSGAWSVRLEGGGRHANHVHPMGWLSSALYMALPENLGGPEHSGWLTLGEPQAELGLDLPPTRMIEPKPGRLALFPSWMWHGTRPIADGERMTVAFDVARPVGSAE